jgi:hypothetical protein
MELDWASHRPSSETKILEQILKVTVGSDLAALEQVVSEASE